MFHIFQIDPTLEQYVPATHGTKLMEDKIISISRDGTYLEQEMEYKVVPSIATNHRIVVDSSTVTHKIRESNNTRIDGKQLIEVKSHPMEIFTSIWTAYYCVSISSNGA